MCGINLIIDKYNQLDTGAVKKMSAQTAHRGPDESKTITQRSPSATYHIAANRLKITDQSDAASQPFIIDGCKQILLFNGEIYNYHKLKNELLNKNISFNSHSDTEVLFHWIREYGLEGISNLEGMFAFIFIDLSIDEIIIARDRFGIKPIYYYDNDQFFIASSEVKAIAESGLFVKELNPSSIPQYLRYKYVKAPETFYMGIYELEHGHTYHCKNRSWEKHKYDLQKIQPENKIPNINDVESLITNSLIQQLDTQVPLGLLLSGGVDSTLLLALAKKEGFTLPTYSIVNSHKDKSFGTKDLKYSRLASKMYASDHHEVEMDISILNQFEEFISKVDQPIGDSSYLMTKAISKYASATQPNGNNGMKILLSGAGADELFAGYNRHAAFYSYLNNTKIFNTIAPLLKPILSVLPTGKKHPLRKHFRLMKKWSISHDPSPYTTFDNFLSFNEMNIGTSQTSKTVSDWFGWAISHDQNNYLIGDVLALSDRASMLHGIELRVPYLNDNLVHYLNKFPAESRIHKGSKWMLKEILSKHGGVKFTKRAKEGFGLPLSGWLFDQKTAHLWDIFIDENQLIFNFLDKKRFDELIDQQKRRVEDHGPLLWSILVLAHWLKQNFK